MIHIGTIKKIIISVLALSCAMPAFSQTFNSGYFTEGYKYRHRLNPAFASTRSYFALPVAGNISVSTESKLGISTLLYPYEGKLATFMHPSVNADDFLGKLNKNNILEVDINSNLFTVGVWGKRGFTTVELNIRSMTSANLPRDLFDFMKNIGAKSTYNISNFGVRSRNYTELAIGHSHQITEHLNIGAKVKLLTGIASADVKIDRMDLTMNEDKWSIVAQGTMKASVPTLDIPLKQGTNELDLSNISFGENFSLSNILSGIGFGAAVDLGAEYRFGGVLKGLNISAAVLDLGFLSWGNGIKASAGENSWEFTGFDDISFEAGDENSIGKQFEALGGELAQMVRFNSNGKGSYSEMLTCTVNLGAEYEMPFYRKMSVGALYSSRIAGAYSKNEGRFFFNIAPTRWFGLSANYGISNFGSSLGAVLSLDFPGIGLFVGSDYIFWDVTAPVAALKGIGLPYKNLNVNLNFGITFNLSRYRTLGDWR